MTTSTAAAFLAAPAGWGMRGRRSVVIALDETVSTLRELRDARFHGGLCCPHCRSVRVQRWGTFSGRQRYRCGKCRRSFSDLTLTPLAYSKRPELWRRFAGCMLESLSVRASARRLGIDKDTAWRWRHAILSCHDGLVGNRFHGVVETLERSLALNRKGQRQLAEPRRRAPGRRRHGSIDSARVWILFGRDRGDGLGAVVVPGHRPGRLAYEALLEPARAIQTLVSPFGAFSPAGTFAISRGIDYVRLPGEGRAQQLASHFHLENVLRFERDFRGWLRRFRGVGTIYLPNYLTWHRVLNSLERPSARLLVESVRGSIPVPAARWRSRRKTT